MRVARTPPALRLRLANGTALWYHIGMTAATKYNRIENTPPRYPRQSAAEVVRSHGRITSAIPTLRTPHPIPSVSLHGNPFPHAGKVLSETSDGFPQTGNMLSEVSDCFAQSGNVLSE
ncbi:MAG: hypothetical protein K2I74_06060, partial [Treponemataceae bacterium]|nr:hypothetical protein [Treponemataceae bacterium]